MRVLVLGASGMLGHRLWIELTRAHEAWGTSRSGLSPLLALPGARPDRLVADVSVGSLDSVIRAFRLARPEVVINCIGLIKQREAAADPLRLIDINARFPHQLVGLCRVAGARLIHISTDGVFSGRKGAYCEDDPTDTDDLYGRSKLLGEIAGEPACLTLRCAFIGRELETHHGLLEWFLAQAGEVKGYQKAIFSGLTTRAFAEMAAAVLLPRPDLEGLFHVASSPISKYDLLRLFNSAFDRRIEVRADASQVIDRSLDGSRFEKATGYSAPAWPQMVQAMAADAVYAKET